MLCWTPSLRQAFAERRSDPSLFNSDNEKMLDHSPKLILAKVRFHVVDNPSFNNCLAMITWIDKMLQGRIHRVRGFQVRSQRNVAEITSNVAALQTLQNRILFSRALPVPPGAAPLLPCRGYFWSGHIFSERRKSAARARARRLWTEWLDLLLPTTWATRRI